MVRDSERILKRESPGTKLNFNHSFQAAEVPDFPGTETMFPTEPLTTCEERYLAVQVMHIIKNVVLPFQKKFALSISNQRPYQDRQQQQQ